MKSITKFFFAFLLMNLIFSCDYEYHGILRNQSDNTITLKISKPGLSHNGDTGIDLVVIEEDEKTGIYKYTLASKKGTVLFVGLNGLSEFNIPFDTLTIITKIDTVILMGKASIFEKFDKKLKYGYEYDIY